MPRVYIKTLGCKVNQTESDKLAYELAARGYEVSDDASAVLAVINSCAVTAEAEHKVRKEVRRALKAFPDAAVLVAGCATVFSGEELSAISDRIHLEPDKPRLIATALEILERSAKMHRPHAGGVEKDSQRLASASLLQGLQKSRVPIKVQDGCDNFCTYCLISRVRGPLKSESFEEIVEEARVLRDSGVGEVVLTGINLARFDDGGRNLAELVRALCAIDGLRIRLSSIEPPDLTEELIEAFKHPNVARHLHVPLQSGSDSILQAMGRTYTVEQYRMWIDRAKRAIDGLTITTDVIVGFPGEGEREFEETLAVCESIGFSKIHVFKYSLREHTPAALMKDHVDAETKTTRAAQLRELGATLRDAFLSEVQGHNLEVIVERFEDDRAMGTSSEYVSVVFDRGADTHIGQRLVLESIQVRDTI